jgi:hypothetical protein
LIWINALLLTTRDGADTHHEASLRGQCCMQICTTLEERGAIALAEGQSDHLSAVLN